MQPPRLPIARPSTAKTPPAPPAPSPPKANAEPPSTLSVTASLARPSFCPKTTWPPIETPALSSMPSSSQGLLETKAVQTIADTYWRLDRIRAMEHNLLAPGVHDHHASVQPARGVVRDTAILAVLDYPTGGWIGGMQGAQHCASNRE